MDENVEEYSQKWWTNKVTEREKELDTKWRASSDKVVKRYLDERDDTPVVEAGDGASARKYNIFWANTQIIKAALYATPPKPEVQRQYGDAKDDVARTASLMLQRMLTFGLNRDHSDMHTAFKVAVEDRLIPGLGQVWLRLDVDTEVIPAQPALLDDFGVEIMPATPEGERIVDQKVLTDYVHWRDFLWEPCRVWSECGWVARICWVRKKDFIKKFGQAKYDEVKSTAKSAKDADGKYPKGFTDGKIKVYEIWCRDTNKVYWISTFVTTILKEQDDPLQLDNFFPCPEPLLSTHTTNDFLPRSDYVMVQDQYEELDILNNRIAILTKALRVVGVYDKTNAELSKLLTGNEFAMIPVDNWAAFSETGGLKGQVDWFPVEVIAEVLMKLMEQRIAVINQIYELTSISDIMRGASNPRDTLGAQKLKAQYSSVRLQLSQQDVGKFVREALRLKVEIICRHFEPIQIYEQSQIKFTESLQYAEQAIELLKDYRSAEYRIDVGEETLSLADYNAERELRVQYLTAVGQFVSQAGQIIEPMPEALPYLLKMIAWVTASFRGASDIESVLDEAINAATKKSQQPQPPPPNPAVVKAKAEAESAAAQDQSRAAADKAISDNDTKNSIKTTLAEIIKDNLSTENKASLQEQKAKDAEEADGRKPKGD
jgi:hypothetical protein